MTQDSPPRETPASSNDGRTGIASLWRRGRGLILLALGLLALYSPIVQQAASTIWTLDDHSHGPLVLIIAAGLFWARRQHLVQAAAAVSWPADTWPWRRLAAASGLIVVALMLYLTGRFLDLPFFSFLSLPLLLAGWLCWVTGSAGLRRAGFALGFLCFAVPLPGLLLDPLTLALKQGVSWVATECLAGLGYPISRAGITIVAGPYHLLVADACSGLHSLVTLIALGVLYLHLTGPRRPVQHLGMLALVLPIAFVANTVRVVLLILLTYHGGEEAGRGFVHDFAGLSLMVTSLLLLLAFDALLGSRSPWRGSRRLA